MAAGGLSLLGISDGAYDGEEHAHVRDWHDFIVVFVARVLVFFGLTMLQTFVLFFFRDVQKIGNPSAGTALYAFCTIAGAVLSSVYLGLLSDRVPAQDRDRVAMERVWPRRRSDLRSRRCWRGCFRSRVLFGIGFGGVMSSGWALAMDAIPKMRDVGRDLGLWGIATSLPNIAAPLVGGWLIGLFGGTRAGYQAVFGLSGFSFALAALSVLRVGRRPLSSLWGWPLRFAAVTSNYAVGSLAYRVRSWGEAAAAPRSDADRRQPSTRFRIAGDRFVDDRRRADLGGIRYLRRVRAACTSRAFLQTGYVAAVLPARRQRGTALHDARTAAARKRAGRARARRLCVGRPSASWPTADRRDLRRSVASRFPRNEKRRSLATRVLRPCARRRKSLNGARTLSARNSRRNPRQPRKGSGARWKMSFVAAARSISPPKDTTRTTGGFGRCAAPSSVWRRSQRSIWSASATIHSFRSASRCSTASCRLDRGVTGEPMMPTLAAIRPVVTSQLLGAWLHERDEAFTADEACAAVEDRIARLPQRNCSSIRSCAATRGAWFAQRYR